MESPDGTLTLYETIPAPQEAVYTYFSDPKHIEVLQPYVYAVEILQDLLEDGVRVIRFHSWERVPVLGGIWKQNNQIEASWYLTEPPFRMESTAYSRPGVHLHIHYQLAPTTQGNTYLTQKTAWQAPRLAHRLVRREVEKTQRGLLTKLRETFEGQK